MALEFPQEKNGGESDVGGGLCRSPQRGVTQTWLTRKAMNG